MITTTDRRAALDLVRAVHVDEDQAVAELLHRPRAELALALVEHLLLLAHDSDVDVDVWLDGLALDLADDRRAAASDDARGGGQEAHA